MRTVAELGGEETIVDEAVLRVDATHVASIEPRSVVAGEPFQLTVRGVAPAPRPEGEPYLDDGVLVVPIVLDGSVVTPPPDPRPFELVYDVPALPAGALPVVLGDDLWPFLLPYARTEIEVVPNPVTLHGGLFGVGVRWEDFDGLEGDGVPASPPSDDSALFFFFGPENWELMVKVLDGCDINGHYWVLGAASTTVAYDLRVTDAALGGEWTFHNQLGTASPAFADVEAFACD